MDEVMLLRKGYGLISTRFELEDTLPEGRDILYQWMRETLKKRIDYLLDHQFDALLNILYQIDLDECRVNQILHQPNAKRISQDLADAVIERQKQKVITRLKYQP